MILWRNTKFKFSLFLSGYLPTFDQRAKAKAGKRQLLLAQERYDLFCGFVKANQAHDLVPVQRILGTVAST